MSTENETPNIIKKGRGRPRKFQDITINQTRVKGRPKLGTEIVDQDLSKALTFESHNLAAKKFYEAHKEEILAKNKERYHKKVTSLEPCLISSDTPVKRSRGRPRKYAERI